MGLGYKINSFFNVENISLRLVTNLNNVAYRTVKILLGDKKGQKMRVRIHANRGPLIKCVFVFTENSINRRK